jgi:putative ABC transport system permease protein
MGVLWDKIWRDLWEHKGRTIQVVLIIAVGTFAIGMIIATRQFMIAGMQDSWRASAPATIYLWADPGIDDDALAVLRHVEGVAELEGLFQEAIEWRKSPGDSWQPAGLNARDDYGEQKLAKLNLLTGAWPHKTALAMGQGADARFGVQQGDTIEVRVANHVFHLRIEGVVYDPNVQPPSFGGNAQFYVTRAEFGNLTGDERFNRILASMASYDEARATAIADEMQDKLEKQGMESGGFSPYGLRVADPAKHFFQDALDGLFFIMGFMAAITLILGLFLVYNTITALINRQVNQIGILKAIGARSRVIFGLYLTIVFCYGVLALLIALPTSVLAARSLGAFLMAAFNAEGEFELSGWAVAVQMAIALLAPLLACLVPVSAGARITVREAISTYGLRASASWLDRLLARIRALPELLALTISNTFRHKQRVILTEITLVLSGLVFMSVMTVRDAGTYTFGDLLFSILRFDVALAMERSERIDRVETLAASQPGVVAVELWDLENATIRLAGQPESNADHRVSLFGVPVPTELYGPQMRAGRWLRPGDGHVVVLNEKLAAEAGVGVGDVVTLKPGIKHATDWLVVGLLFDPIIVDSAHVPRAVLARDLHQVDRARTIWVQSAEKDPAGQAALARELREVFDEHRIRLQAGSVFGRDTAAEIIAGIMSQFAVIITLLATMAVLIGVVGSLALSGVLSLNVLERTREIGVLRAIGAPSRVVAGLFIGEGLILGWLSWLIAWPLSILVGQAMVQGLSAALNTRLVYQYTPAGALIWLGIITVLALLASGLPARSASRISVRESLVYE